MLLILSCYNIALSPTHFPLVLLIILIPHSLPLQCPLLLLLSLPLIYPILFYGDSKRYSRTYTILIQI